MKIEPDRVQKSDDELVVIADVPAVWLSLDGYASSLRGAIERLAQISSAGRSPYPLQGPHGIRVEHPQMLRLWQLLRNVATDAHAH